MRAIAYSLFGYQQNQKSGFDFPSFARGLMVNVRFNRLLYPGWVNVIHMDKESYTSPYQPLFDWFIDRGFIDVVICANESLCKNMLWRLKPVFETDESGNLKYTHTLCRDLDSICTYREVQAVTTWISDGKVIHCITDSVSHNIPMMGGMIGIAASTFADRVGAKTWDALMSKSDGINYTVKGADQTFLNKYVYPPCAESATEHFVLGMVHNLPEGNGRHYSIEDIKLSIPAKYKVTNDCAGHVGAAGYYDMPTVNFLKNIDPFAKEYWGIEDQFKGLFPWAYDRY